MTHSKPQPPLPNTNTISPGSRSGPPPPYSEDVERGVNETSPLSSANAGYHTVPRDVINAYQSTSRSPPCKTFRTLLLFSILAIIFTLYLHEWTTHQLLLDSLTWTELAASSRCLRYNTREYSALLKGVPNDEDGVQLCTEKKIAIHGTIYKKPTHCTINVDTLGTTMVFGHWIVESNEPRCMTTWEDFKDKGCTANESHYRRIEAHMGNHQPPWDNWREMCATTPADYVGHHFDRPDSCDSNMFTGVTGVWFIKDASC